MAAIDALPRSEPEPMGLSSRAVLDFLREADDTLDSLHGFMLLRRGAVVAEGAWKPYRLESPHMLFSLSKSFASTAVGLAVAEGLLAIDDPVVSFFPDKAPRRPSPRLAAMRVRHLLSMTTGHAEDTTDRIMRRRDPVRAFLGLPLERDPGSLFVYNSGASFMLSAIVQRLTGARLVDYLGPRLFDKLGIEGARWAAHPSGVDFGGFGLELKLEDIARFGQLWLRRGLWRGERVIPEDWIEEASARQVDNASAENPDPASDWQQGYGYQFWRSRHGSYRGDGAFGQFCAVMPALDAVFVAFSGLSDMQAPLDLVWKRLLPAMSTPPLPPDPAAAEELRRFCSGLELRHPKAAPAPGAGTAVPGAGATAAASAPAGMPAALSGRRYRFAGNPVGIQWMGFGFGDDSLEITYRMTRRRDAGNGLTGPLESPRDWRPRSLRCGYGEWLEGVSRLEGEGPRKAACSGAWNGPGIFEMRHAATGTPFVTTFVFFFEGDILRIEARRNVGFGPIEPTLLEGRAMSGRSRRADATATPPGRPSPRASR